METSHTIVTSLHAADIDYAAQRARTTHESIILTDVEDRLEISVDPRGHIGFRHLRKPVTPPPWERR